MKRARIELTVCVNTNIITWKQHTLYLNCSQWFNVIYQKAPCIEKSQAGAYNEQIFAIIPNLVISSLSTKEFLCTERSKAGPNYKCIVYTENLLLRYSTVQSYFIFDKCFHNLPGPVL